MIRNPRLLLLAAAAILVGACLVGRRSDEFACESAADCAPDRGCSQGYCVVPVCPPGCTCQTLLPDRGGYADCTINCNGNSCRNTTVACPAGMACTIRCASVDDCQRVDCSEAASCTVECSGNNACDGGVTCGNGACRVTCSGTSSCDAGVACGSSCRCDVLCNGTNSCATPATCPPSAACDNGLGCTSVLGGICNSCS